MDNNVPKIKERRIFSFKELLTVPVQDNNDPLICVADIDRTIVMQYKKLDMVPFFGEKIFVRKLVAEKLHLVNVALQNGYPEARLKIVYGYRSLEVQEKYFETSKARLKAENPEWDDAKLVEETHLITAEPQVGGHPSGGAVDVTVSDSNGVEWDMGSGIANFEQKDLFYTFAEKVDAEQLQRRLYLHDLMVEVGFAPFYGEWWHFSYGDREWAAIYEKEGAIYGSVKLEK